MTEEKEGGKRHRKRTKYPFAHPASSKHLPETFQVNPNRSGKVERARYMLTVFMSSGRFRPQRFKWRAQLRLKLQNDVNQKNVAGISCLSHSYFGHPNNEGGYRTHTAIFYSIAYTSLCFFIHNCWYVLLSTIALSYL